MRVLIIDDSSTMRCALTACVVRLDAEAVTAGDGLEAIEALEAQPAFEVALVDWDMPRMTGIEFVRHVRDHPRHRDMKLIMVTAHVEFEDVREALECGADDYLMKPVTGDMIAEKFRLLGLTA